MIFHEGKPRLGVPSFVFGENYTCTYCGQPTNGLDHVIPVSFLDFYGRRSKRNFKSLGIKTWACRECNNFAGEKHFSTFADRANFINSSIKNKYKRITRTIRWDEEEINELGHGLKSFIIGRENMVEWVKTRLVWQRGQGYIRIINNVQDYVDYNFEGETFEMIRKFFMLEE